MRRAILDGPGELRIETCAEPVPGPGEVIVEVVQVNAYVILLFLSAFITGALARSTR